MDEPKISVQLNGTKCKDCGAGLVPATVMSDGFFDGKTAIGKFASQMSGRSILIDHFGNGSHEHTPERCREMQLEWNAWEEKLESPKCSHCERPVPDSNPICEDCAWDIHDRLDGLGDTVNDSPWLKPGVSRESHDD
jgi:hypothetical protein